MAAMERETSSIFEGWEKWKIALAVGAPICLGVAGLWYYNKTKQTQDSTDSNGKAKPVPKEKVKHSAGGSAAGPSGEHVLQDSPLAVAQEHKNNGNKCFKQGKYDEAIKFYTQALEICPLENKTDISTFYANRAAAYDKLKDYRKVLENCSEAIKLNGKYTKALSRRANAAEQLGELQISLEDVTAVCILEGFQNQSTLQMADRVLKNLGKAKAKIELKNKKPSMPSKHNIKSYFASFTQDPVQTCFQTRDSDSEEKLLNIPATSGDSLAEATEGDTQQEEAGEVQVTQDGSNELQRDGSGEQIDDTQQLVNGDQSHSTQLFSEDSIFKSVVDKLQSEQYEELIPLCTQEVNMIPPTHYLQLALLLRGTMFYLTAQSTQALADFDELLIKDNLDKKVKVNALIKRGCLLLTRDQQTNGLADFALAARIDPQNSDIYHHRGHQNIQIDRLEDSLRDFENSILKNPDFPNSYIQKSYAEHRRAAAEQSTTKLEKAINSYEESLKKFPENADGHSLYAQALCDLGRFEDADREFETAITLEPGNANTLVQRALLKLQWKQTTDESVSLIKQAIELDDKCEYAYEMLGTIEVQRGDMVNAVRLFEKAIELCRTESEMSHLFSLLHAAKAQLKAAETLGIPLPSNFSPM